MRISSSLVTVALTVFSISGGALGSSLTSRQSSGRTTPLIIPFPGQAPLPTISQVQSQNASTGDVLPLQNIQGDILIGQKKQIESLIFFHINNAASFKKALGNNLHFITSTETLIDSAPQQPLAFVNLAFSQTGLTALGITDNLNDTEFSHGMFSDAPNLGDDTSKWISPFTGTTIHGVAIVGTDKMSLVTQYQGIINSVFGNSIQVLTTLTGQARPGNEFGHEHFGFLDGISQPAITGFPTTAPLPGQAVVQNGVILTGREGDPMTRPSWALDGTFLAFRYFQQLVPEFNKYLLDNSVQNTAMNLTVQGGADFLGARMFGRWKSGAPIDITPEVDDPALGADPERNNNFDYSDTLTNETRCPFAAHTRKVNPRADLPAGAADGNHAIRSSIPYGPEVTAAEAASNTTTENRGLLFIEYQSVIANGFRTQQMVWADNPKFPPKNPIVPGLDAIIGQELPMGAPGTGGLDPNNQNKTFIVPQFVIPKGGEYFFVPSIPALSSSLFSG